MVYILLLVLGLALLFQGYLLVSLIKDQRELQAKVAHLARSIQSRRPEARKAPSKKTIERGRPR
ncbi:MULTISPECIES: hypothetical protein [Enterococcus]|uniref:hypothetical protein n=1 Tax=Enterococcus TaxID=1350 RepID=UPI001A9BCB48|nr:hypothetical protein [Enterococcus sp. 665A]MBO1338205.1 hypothetical protein [Enterococcus sp. 665A]